MAKNGWYVRQLKDQDGQYRNFRVLYQKGKILRKILIKEGRKTPSPNKEVMVEPKTEENELIDITHDENDIENQSFDEYMANRIQNISKDIDSLEDH